MVAWLWRVCSISRDITYACSSFSVSKALNFDDFLVRRRSLNLRLNLSCKYPLRSIRMEISDNCTPLSANNESRGALVVFEGLDRSGKTSKCGRLFSNLEGLGHSVELWRFPDRTTSVGQMISAYLTNKSQLDDHTIHLLFSANRWRRYQLFVCRSMMETKLKAGTTLIVDRYSYSRVAFSTAKALDFEWCKAPEIGLIAPDLVVYLDITPEKAAERGGYGGERYDQLEFQRKVAQHYKLLKDSSWKIVDACQSLDDVEKQVKEIVLQHIIACQKGKILSSLWSCI
ncbi:thymidylate kinase-like isoform X1 [Gossypium australe]|uniref:Thymidylate kinase n=1 Tax=Gossypium australe TaxID=47621 RepID=A0A5B6UKS3_9ROSI|nr:thymidylate kinase-like isoform X1 [Gossypium australe]